MEKIGNFMIAEQHYTHVFPMVSGDKDTLSNYAVILDRPPADEVSI